MKTKKITIKNTFIQSISVLMTFLYIYIFIYNYKSLEKDLEKEIENCLKISIKEDEVMRSLILPENITIIKTSEPKRKMTLITNKDTIVTPKINKELGFEERRSKAVQTAMYDYNPLKISYLDSLFSLKLQENQIKAKTIIWIKDNLKNIEQHSGSIIGLKKVLTEKPIQLGGRNELSIQVYFAISPIHLLLSIPFIYWFGLSSWIFIAIGIFYFSYRRNLLRPDSIEQLPFYPDSICKKLLPSLNYNPINQKLIYKGKIFTFSSLSEKLLRAFILTPNHFLSMDELKQKAWDTKFVSDKAVRTAISRLKRELKDIPVIRIVTITNTGYRMEFLQLPDIPLKETDKNSISSL